MNRRPPGSRAQLQGLLVYLDFSTLSGRLSLNWIMLACVVSSTNHAFIALICVLMSCLDAVKAGRSVVVAYTERK